MTLPANIDAEKSVLGAILSFEHHYDEVAANGLMPEHFSLDSHRKIFTGMVALAESSLAIDMVTLIDWLEKHDQLKLVGDVGYVASLSMGMPDRPSVSNYVSIVKEKAAQRSLISACNAAAAGLEQEMTSKDAQEYLTDKMLEVQSGSDEAPARRVIEFSDSTYAQWLRLGESDRELMGLRTGIDALDLATTGIRDGEIWVYGGRPKDGKTNLALQALAANCAEGIPCAMFSVEMRKESLMHRLWAGESGVDYNHIRYPRRLQPELKRKIELAMVEVAKWPLFVVDQGSIPLSQLIAKAKLLIRREKVKLIAVDYLQLVTTQAKDERQQLTKISHGLMALAKETGVPVIEVSQLARPRDGNENLRPTKFNLKESGTIEQDAHVIVLIYRPVDEKKIATGEDELIIAAQRDGSTGSEPVVLTNWLRFKERSAYGN